MKLVIAIIQEKDVSRLQSELTKNKFTATQLPTKGGFLRSKNLTFMIGVEDERVSEVIDIIKDTCESRKQYVTPPISLPGSISENSYPVEVQVGGATVMVLPIEKFLHF